MLACTYACGRAELDWTPRVAETVRRSTALSQIGKVTVLAGRAIAQAVSRWRPGFESGSGLMGFLVDKVALGQVFSEYFGFPCQSSFHQILHHHNHPGQVQ
jgi:hypothetical protein